MECHGQRPAGPTVIDAGANPPEAHLLAQPAYRLAAVQPTPMTSVHDGEARLQPSRSGSSSLGDSVGGRPAGSAYAGDSATPDSGGRAALRRAFPRLDTSLALVQGAEPGYDPRDTSLVPNPSRYPHLSQKGRIEEPPIV